MINCKKLLQAIFFMLSSLFFISCSTYKIKKYNPEIKVKSFELQDCALFCGNELGTQPLLITEELKLNKEVNLPPISLTKQPVLKKGTITGIIPKNNTTIKIVNREKRNSLSILSKESIIKNLSLSLCKSTKSSNDPIPETNKRKSYWETLGIISGAAAILTILGIAIPSGGLFMLGLLSLFGCALVALGKITIKSESPNEINRPKGGKIVMFILLGLLVIFIFFILFLSLGLIVFGLS